MTILEILNDKTVKPKVKTETLAQAILSKKIKIDALLKEMHHFKDPQKATCIEALEFITVKDPSIATAECLEAVTNALKEKAPRIKWESAKVIGNIAHLFPAHLDEPVKNLLENTKHEGTVVRWAAAYALTQIYSSGYKKSSKLLSTLKKVCDMEEKNSIKKIYLKVLK